ncbi:hypothetical protein Fot_56462 [Forsythia ovata]|uniref:Uncharacterized protein n=1 Tax=Forsythia ovata TaxID=205694 RepID=A0ABD1NZK7_9LAMI
MKEKGVPLTPKVVRFLTGRRNSFKKKASLNFRGIRIGIRPCPSGRDWVAPLFRGTAVVTEHGKDARRLPRRLSLAWRLTQHNRRAEPSPTITVRRRAGVTSWKRTCKA